MCIFLNEIRQLIGKYTKFKIWKWPSLPQGCTASRGILLSIFVVAAVIFPGVGGIGNSLNFKDSSDFGKIVQSSLSPSREFHGRSWFPYELWFTGGDTSSPERPMQENDWKSGTSDRRNSGIVNNTMMYQLTATDAYFLDEEEGSSDEGTFPFNQTTVTTTTTTTLQGNSTIHGRQKRDVIFADTTLNLARRRRKILNPDTEGTFVISNVGRSSPQYYEGTRAIDINCQQDETKTLVFAIEEIGNDLEKQRKLMIYQLNDRDLKQQLLMTTEASDAVAVEVFKIKGDLFAFTTVKHNPQGVESPDTINTGSTLYRINLSNNTLDKTQTIHLPFAQSSTFWSGMGEEADDQFLVIAPSKAITETGTTFNVMVPCYRWQGGYFDYVSQFPATNPQSINHFNMFSHDYLAVANYQDDTGSTSIQSEIFKYQYNEGRFVSFQKIKTYGAKDIKHFTFESVDGSRKEHFIAIANSCTKDEDGKLNFYVQSPIMKYGQVRFLPFKTFYAYGAQQFLPVKHKDKFFLALADFHGIRMFQYNGWTFVETFHVKYETEQSTPFSLSLRQLNHQDTSYITLASKTPGIQNGMFAVDFETRNDHRKLIHSVETWCDGAKNLMDKKTSLMQLESEINSAPKISDERVLVSGKLIFTKVIQVDNLQSMALRMGRSRNLGGEEVKILNRIGDKYRLLQSRLEEVRSDMDNVVWVDKTQDILGPVFFDRMEYGNPQMEIGDLQMSKFGSLAVPDRLKNLVFLDRPESLKAIRTDMLIANELSTLFINGHLMKDYAFRNPTGKQVFTGHNEFISKVQVKDSIKVQDNFAGLSFTRPNFLLTKGNQTFPDVTMHLTDTEVKNLYTRILNGHNVFFIFLDALPLSGGTIKAGKRMEKMEVRKLKANSINNVNINGLFDNAVFIDQRFPVQGFLTPKYFESMRINELNPLVPSINEAFDLSWNFINVEQGEYKFKNLVITQDMQVNDLFVLNQLNSIKVFEGRMDVFLKDSREPQRIKSKRLESIRFNDHVEATEKVDGIELQNWSQVLSIKLGSSVIKGVLNVPGNLNALSGINVGRGLQQNQSNVLNILEKTARLDSAQLPGSCELVMEDLKVEGNSDINGFINGNAKPSQWVVNSNHREILITGEKIFAGPVHLETDTTTNGLFGSLNKAENLIEVFPQLLLDGPDQVITQEMVFTQNFKADKASCSNVAFDGINFNDLLFKTGDQVMEGESVFKNQPLVAMNGATVHENLGVESVNKMDLSEQIKDTLRTMAIGTQTVTAEYSFTEISTKETIVMGSFAQSDVESVFGNIVSHNQDQIKLRSSHLSFTELTILDHLDFVGHLNGIPTGDWGHSWLLTRGDQVVDTKVVFAGPVTATHMDAPSVNSVNIRDLAQDIIRIDQDEVLDQPMTFVQPAFMNSGVEMPNAVNVNGDDLKRDVLLKSSPSMQIISGSNSFMKGMTILGHLSVDEVPNFDFGKFSELVQSAEGRALREQTPMNVVINGNVRLEKEPYFETKINEHKWQDILNSLWFSDKDVEFNHPVHFSKVNLEHGAIMGKAATLNNLNLKEFWKSYAFSSQDNVWTGQVTIKQVEELNRLEAQSLVVDENGLFNGENIKEFYDSVLRYSGDQTILSRITANVFKTVQLNIEEDATLNLMNAQDFMTVSGPNEVSSMKSFENIQANTIVLSPDTVLDGVNLGNWNENAVRRDGIFNVQGPLEFESLEAFDNVIVNGLVDGIKYDVDNVLTSDKDQVILGSVTIKGPRDLPDAPALKAPAGVVVNGALNGIDVKDSVSRLVFADTHDDRPIRIKSGTVFDAPVVMNQVKTDALLQGQNVSEAMGHLKRSDDEMSRGNFVAKSGYEQLLNMANMMMQVSEKKAVFLDHYILTQRIQVQSTYCKVLTSVGYPTIAIGFKKSERITTENWWSFNAPLDYYQLQIGNRVQMEGTVVDIAELEHEKGNFFAFAVNDEGIGRPAQAHLDVMNTISNFEMNKAPNKLSKTFILQTVDTRTPRMRQAVSQVIHGNRFKSVKSFPVMRQTGTSSCMITTSEAVNPMESTAGIYCLDKENGILNKIQEIVFDSPSLTTAVVTSNKTLLGILTRSRDRQPEGLLELWSSVDRSGALGFVKQECLPVFNVVSMDTLSTNDGKTFLAIASGALPGSEYGGSVFIFRLSQQTHKFKKVQTIEVSHPLDVKLQLLKSNEIVSYILSDSVTNNVHVFKYKGVSGWIREHTFTSENGRSLQVAAFTVDNIDRAQLLVTSPTETKIYAAEFKGSRSVVEEENTDVNKIIMNGFVDVDNL